MLPPAPALNETERLHHLRALGVLDTPAEERFDRITRIAQRLFGVPIALVSLVAADRQWFKSRVGLAAAETSRAISFCGHAILSHRPLIVPDTLLDERFHDNPLVTGAPHIRFYAGHPLVVGERSRVGTLCLIDHVPRAFGDRETRLLADLAQMAQRELAGAHLPTTDTTTGLSNRRGLLALGEHLAEACRRAGAPLSLLLIDVAGNDCANTPDPAADDPALVAVAAIVRKTLRCSDLAARVGARAIAVVLAGTDTAGAARAAARLHAALADRTAWPGQRPAPCRIGEFALDAVRHPALADLLREADHQLHAASRVR